MGNERAAGWFETSLPEVIDFREGPGILAKDFRNEGVPLIRLMGLTGGSLLAGCNFLDPAMVAARWSHFRVELGDTLLSTSASLGRVARVDEQADGSIPYTGIIRMRPRGPTLLSDYVPYVLQDPTFERQVRAMGAGSVMQHFGPSHLRQMTVVVPPVDDQRAIASVLRVLTEKIEHNCRLAAALAEILRTRFDNARLAHESTTVPLSSIAKFVNGRNFTREADGQGYPVLRIAELTRGLNSATVRSSTRPPEHHLARAGDLLFAWSGTLGVHRWNGPEGIVNQHIFKVLPNGVPSWFVEQWLRLHLERFRRIAADKATTMGHIRRGDLDEAVVTMPAGDEAEQLWAFGEPMDALRMTMLAESRTLTAIRDALLPKLVSGQIRVPLSNDSEEQVGAAIEALT